ncbi:type IV pilus assembly protein FimV, partial [Cognatilysobacter lacus]
MRSTLRSACLLALALASGSAQALGLGQIQVKSRLGEPLLAEIPVISSDASELVDLDAGLASPETFTRVGLEPPYGIVADLHFTVGSDAQGHPLIRITTTQPVTQPLLDFLVEVDWGQGKLVREYSATLAQPGSVAAGPDVAVEAPAVEAAPVVERPQAS